MFVNYVKLAKELVNEHLGEIVSKMDMEFIKPVILEKLKKLDLNKENVYIKTYNSFGYYEYSVVNLKNYIIDKIKDRLVDDMYEYYKLKLLKEIKPKDITTAIEKAIKDKVQKDIDKVVKSTVDKPNAMY